MFKNPIELRAFISEQYMESGVSSDPDFDLGYFKPGRDSPRVYIKSNANIQCMYEAFKNQDEINIWYIGEHLD